jgi:hypothetical protein
MRWKMMKIIGCSILLIASMFSVSGCSAYYSDMTGTVVDAETGKSIEGAVVLVEWTKRVGLGDYHTESVKVVEVVTDKKGEFTVTGLINPFVDPPDVTVYKKGYVAWNNRSIFPDYKRRDDFVWKSGSVFKLEHFVSSYSYDAHVSFINSMISSTIAYDRKKGMREAFEWETDLAYKEVKEKRDQIKVRVPYEK